jgi:hypothetical protein
MTLGGGVVEGMEGATQRMGSAIALQVRVFDLSVCSARRLRLTAEDYNEGCIRSRMSLAEAYFDSPICQTSCVIG